MKLNDQPITKQHLDPDGILRVHSIFPTIQGEGPLAGVPATFVRLNGCNLQCPLCDTDYTSVNDTMTPEMVLLKIAERTSPLKFVVITGGEPLAQNITPLVELLLDSGYQVQIETNGTLFLADLPYHRIEVVCSPKTGSVHRKLVPNIDAFKYVVHAWLADPADGLPITALNHTACPILARPPKEWSGPVYIQPVDTDDPHENKQHLGEAINSVTKFGYVLCVQIHKIIGLE